MLKKSKANSGDMSLTALYDSLVSLGGRYQKEQLSYAKEVEALLTNKQGGLGVLEAETGLGKSIGYLLPVCLYLATHTKKGPILISTHTRALQLQLLKSDLPLVAKVLQASGLDMPEYAFRMGRAAFFSPGRVFHLASKAKSNRKKFLSFAQQVSVICQQGTGLWQDYVEEYGELPFNLSPDDVCLLDGGQVDNPAYQRHIEQAKKARLVITNHSSILNQHIFTQNVHMVVMDEAHEILDVCTSMTNYRLQINKIRSVLEHLELTSRKKNQLSALCQQLEDKLLSLKAQVSDSTAIATEQMFSEQMQDIGLTVSDLLRQTEKLYQKLSESMGDNAEQTEMVQIDYLKQLKEINQSLTGFCLKDGFRRRGVGFSKKRRTPSLSSYNPNAGFLFAGRMAQITNRILLTSATLGDLKSGDLSFTRIRHDLGLGKMDVVVVARFAPQHYGEMKFVKTSKQIAKPVKEFEEGVARFDPQWFKHTVKMIEAAASRGPTLVLTNSFAEVEYLQRRLQGQEGYLFHKPEFKVSQMIEQFSQGVQSQEYRCLITPSMWHGVSLRSTDGIQLISELVITRLPFKPFAEDEHEMFKESMMLRGYSPSSIDSIAAVGRMRQCAHKLKQGLGRGIRSPDDSVTVWFADPRFTFDSQTKTGLINAIPDRFISNYMNGEIFGEITKKQKRVFL